MRGCWRARCTAAACVLLLSCAVVGLGPAGEGAASSSISSSSSRWRRSLLQDAAAAQQTADTSRSFVWDWRTGLMLALTFLVSALSMPAGIGGGIIFVPLIDALLQFSARAAAAQSQAFILGGALGSAWVTLARRHPDNPARTLIDFDILLLLMPLMLCGVAGGVLANRSLPNWLITFLLLVVLLWQTWVSLMKTLAMLRKQRQARRAQRAQQQQAKAQQAQQRQMQACQELARLPVGGPAAAEEGEGDGASSGASSPREGGGGSPLLGGSPRVLSRRASFAERLSRTSWGSFAEIPSLEASADWGCEGQEAGGSARRVHSAHSVHSTGASHPRADGGGAPPIPRSSKTPAGRGPEAGAAKRPVGLGGAAGGSTHSILPTIPSVEARLDALESGPPHQGQAGRGVIPAGSPASRKISGGTSRSDGSTGGSSTGSAAGKPPLLRAVAHSMRQAARELRPPTLDGPTLRRLSAVAGCWVPFVGFQAARAELAKSNGTACTPGYEALLALEFVFLLSLAAAYTGFVVWTRRRQQRQRVGVSMAAAGGAQTGAAGSLPPPAGRSGAGAAPKAGAAGDSGAAAAVVAVAAGPAGSAASSSDDCAGGSCWSLRKLLIVQLITAVGGTLATALGLGGGLVMGPLLLALDVHPLVASATSSFMVLLTVGSATLTYSLQGDLNADYSLIFGASCLLGALLGVVVINSVVRRSGATWLVVCLMTAVVAGGAVICASVSMPKAVRGLQDGTSTGFHSLCSFG